MTDTISDGLREQIITIAEMELGSTDAKKYITDTCGSYFKCEWCQIFVLWCLRTAGVTQIMFPVGKGFFNHLTPTKTPKRGDIICMRKFWHTGIVTNVHPDGSFDMIAGNTPNVSNQLNRRVADVYSFYDLTSWKE